MLAILFVLKPVNNRNTAPTMQHIHSQLVRSLLTLTKTMEEKWLSDYLKSFLQVFLPAKV